MRAQLLNILGQNEAALAGSSTPTDGLKPPFYMTDDRSGNPYIIPAISKMYNRNNADTDRWTSSGYWTTFYTRYSSTNDAIQRYGYAHPNMSNKNNSGQAHNKGGQHQMIYAKNKSIGYSIDWKASNNNTSYGPFGTLLLYLKNTNTSTTTCTLNSFYANYYSSGHDGSSATLYTPNTASKSTTTDVSIGQVWSRSSGNSTYTSSGNFSIGAGRTVALVIACTAQYRTTFSSGGHWGATNWVYNLNSLFPAGVIPDYNMYATAYMTTNPLDSNYPSSTASIADTWENCHRIFGD